MAETKSNLRSDTGPQPWAYFSRHAITGTNEKGRQNGGEIDTALTIGGLRELMTIAEYTNRQPNVDVGAIYSSLLVRALGSALVFAAIFGIDRIIKHDGLRERKLGEIAGMSDEEVEAYIEIHGLVTIPRPGGRRIPVGVPGEESLDRTHAFVTGAVNEIRIMERERHAAGGTGSALIVGSGGSGAIAIGAWYGLSPEESMEQIRLGHNELWALHDDPAMRNTEAFMGMIYLCNRMNKIMEEATEVSSYLRTIWPISF